MPPRIEAVIVCAGYSDFLAWSLPLNKLHFDYIVVATAPWDAATRKLCEHHNVHCVVVPELNPKPGVFCKGKAINAGLKVLKKDSWIVHLDADIVVPPRFREIFLRADLDASYIYGCDRLLVKSFDDWYAFTQKPEVQYENNVFVHSRPFKVGVRISSPAYGGYVPIGFFQAWHADSKVFAYPEDHTDAGRGDMLFTTNWPRRRRGFLPEVFVYHLESAAAPMGANWRGRKTPPFAPQGWTPAEGSIHPMEVEQLEARDA